MAVHARATRYNFALAFFVALGSFTYGYNSSVTTSVIGLPTFFAYFGIDVSTTQGSSLAGAINGLFSAGGAIGCWFLGYLADTLGRRRAIQLICVVCIVSAVLQAGSVHIGLFLVSRFLNGIGVGMINSIVPMYQSETAPATQRGRLVGVHGFLIVSGYVSLLRFSRHIFIPLLCAEDDYDLISDGIRVAVDGPRTDATSKRTQTSSGASPSRCRLSPLSFCLWAPIAYPSLHAGLSAASGTKKVRKAALRLTPGGNFVGTN